MEFPIVGDDDSELVNRRIALEAAVRTQHTGEEPQAVVERAGKFLAFLQGE